jgi:hypothetical protein
LQAVVVIAIGITRTPDHFCDSGYNSSGLSFIRRWAENRSEESEAIDRRVFAGILPILGTADQGLGIDGTFHVHGTLTITP